MHDKVNRIKKMQLPPVPPELAHRLPPGQVLTDRFPILHEGDVPSYDLDTWTLRIFGEVNEVKEISYAELMKLPKTQIKADIHCVTRWSKFDTEWEGISVRDLLKALDVKPQAEFAMIHADHDYETNLPAQTLLADNALLAYSFQGAPLTPKHGWPLRLVIPSLYFWKSAKWIRGIEYITEDRHGYWERLGFHNEAEPFAEQRFSGEDLNIPDDEWHHKDFD